MQRVEVVHVFSDKTVFRTEIAWHSGMRVIDALELSGVYLRYPDLRDSPVGVYGKTVEFQDTLDAGSRVEIYRCLQADPKEQRRQRAKKKLNVSSAPDGRC